MSPVRCCWHLIIMFVWAPRFYKSHSKTEHKKQTWKPMTHIDGVGTFWMAFFPHYKAPGPMGLLKSNVIFSTWLSSFLDWRFFLIFMRGWDNPNKGKRINLNRPLPCPGSVLLSFLGNALLKWLCLLWMTDNLIQWLFFKVCVVWLHGSWCFLPKCYRERDAVNSSSSQKSMGQWFKAISSMKTVGHVINTANGYGISVVLHWRDIDRAG